MRWQNNWWTVEQAITLNHHMRGIRLIMMLLGKMLCYGDDRVLKWMLLIVAIRASRRVDGW